MTAQQCGGNPNYLYSFDLATNVAPMYSPGGAGMWGTRGTASGADGTVYTGTGDGAAEAIRHFDDAVRAQPDYIESYVGRAEARRLLEQWELSLPDCNKIIQLNADDPRGYNCRGFARQMLKQPDAALTDFDQAIRLNPNFIIAYEHRGTTYTLLRQYDRAVQDYTQAIRLAPRNPLFLARRGEAYSNLKQYDKAIRDFTEAIRLQPNDKNAYRLRAMAEQASGDTAGAAADREQMKEAQGKKKKM